MATLPKVLINQADSKSAGGVALRVRTQGSQQPHALSAVNNSIKQRSGSDRRASCEAPSLFVGGRSRCLEQAGLPQEFGISDGERRNDGRLWKRPIRRAAHGGKLPLRAGSPAVCVD